jgi:hypothetical protein
MIAASGSSNVILGVVVGGVVGLVSSISAAAFSEHRKINEERRRFAALAAGALSAVLHHLEAHLVREQLLAQFRNAIEGKPVDVLLVLPIRGSFLESVGKMESSIALLPPQIIDRVSRALISIRGLIEDFTTLRNTPASSESIGSFLLMLIGEIATIEESVPPLVQELRIEARIDRDILTGYSN